MLEQVQIKQRIVGAVVLLSLAVILVPLLMDDPAQEVKILESNVTPWPEEQPLNVIDIDEAAFSPIVEPIAQQPEAEQPEKGAVTAKTPVAKSAPATTATKPKAPVKERSTTAKQSPSSGKRWEVQVVSYGLKNRKRAERFLQRMKQKGYSVELKEIKKTLRLVTKPLTSEKAAKEMKGKIDRDFKVDQVNSMIRLLK